MPPRSTNAPNSARPDDDAFANLADLQRAEQLLLLLVEFFFQNLALREHDAMALVVEVDDLEPQLLADEFVEVADGLATDLRCGHEAAHAEVDENAALDDLRDGRFDHFVVVVRFDDFFPRLECAGAAFAQIELAIVLIDPMDHHFEFVADAEFFRLDDERKLAEGQNAFGLAADVDEQFVLIFCNDDADEDLALVENLEALFVQALLERELVFFFLITGVAESFCAGVSGEMVAEMVCVLLSFIFYFWQPRHHQVPR